MKMKNRKKNRKTHATPTKFIHYYMKKTANKWIFYVEFNVEI